MNHKAVTAILAGWVTGTAGAQIYIVALSLAGVNLSAAETAGVVVWWGLIGLLAVTVALLLRKV